ncbi:Nn.00g059170.m01.CDS01 [Neocucurbitaria sp. VM-36]
MAGYCPTCEVKMSLTFLDAIAKAFQEAGGPWYDKGVTKEAYLHLRRGWHLARLQLQETVDVIKVSVAYEAQWEAEHPDEVAAAQKANTSTKAVQMAEMEQKYPAVVSVVLASEAMRKLSKASIRPKERKSIKKVTFVPGTNFKPSRHSAKYHRGSRCYQPGVHTCKPGTEWLNVSRCGSIPADLCNLKIFVTTSHDEFDKLDRDATLRPGQMQGLVGSHPGAKVISDFTQKFQELRDGGTEELVQMVKHADAMIVLVEGDNVLDVYLSHSNDIEDEDGEEDVVDQSRWTCLKEIMASM